MKDAMRQERQRISHRRRELDLLNSADLADFFTPLFLRGDREESAHQMTIQLAARQDPHHF
jgi:hypothetical protein